MEGELGQEKNESRNLEKRRWLSKSVDKLIRAYSFLSRHELFLAAILRAHFMIIKVELGNFQP